MTFLNGRESDFMSLIYYLQVLIFELHFFTRAWRESHVLGLDVFHCEDKQFLCVPQNFYGFELTWWWENDGRMIILGPLMTLKWLNFGGLDACMNVGPPYKIISCSKCLKSHKVSVCRDELSEECHGTALNVSESVWKALHQRFHRLNPRGSTLSRSSSSWEPRV